MVTITRIEIGDYFGSVNLERKLDPKVFFGGCKNGSGKTDISKLCYTLMFSGDIHYLNKNKHLITILKSIFYLFKWWVYDLEWC